MDGRTMWYERDLRRILVDRHIPDWNERFFSKFDAEAYAEMMAKAHVTCAEVYAGNSLGICLFPTKRGYPHAQLKGRDFFGDVVAACRRRNIDVQAYFSFWASKPYDLHPEFRMVLEDGTGTKEYKGGGRWGICCMNGPFGEYFLAELDEINSNYDVKGFWVDMFGWGGGVCYCEACKRKWREASGMEIPRFIDWNNPAWNRYLAWRQDCQADFARRIVETIKSKHPERTVNIQAAILTGGWQYGTSEGFALAGDYLAGDFTDDAQQQSYVCKMFSALSKTRPMEFMTPRCEDLGHHTTERTLENMTMRAYAALANQSAFTLIDAVDPEGTLDERFYEHAACVNDRYAAYEKYVSSQSSSLADAAFFHSFTSQVNTDAPCPVPMAERVKAVPIHDRRKRNWVKALQGRHLQFTYTMEALDNLAQFPVVILSDASRMTDRECDAIRKYVADGGRLYASYTTSLYDPVKGIRRDFALADVFGVHYKGRTEAGTYIAPASPKSVLSDYATEQYPMMLDSRQCILEADDDAAVEGTLTLPIGVKGDKELFSSGISDPPMCPKGTPALVRHRYGKGEVIYCAGLLEDVGHAYHQAVLGRLLAELRGTPFVETSAPATVEVTVFEQAQKKRLVVSLLNLPQDLPAAPLFDIKVRLNLPDGISPQQVLLAPAETPVQFQQYGNAIAFDVPRLDEFAMFLVTLR